MDESERSAQRARDIKATQEELEAIRVRLAEIQARLEKHRAALLTGR